MGADKRGEQARQAHMAFQDAMPDDELELIDFEQLESTLPSVHVPAHLV